MTKDKREKVWSRLDDIGVEFVEERREFTNEDFAIALASYSVGVLYCYLSIPEANRLISETKKQVLEGLLTKDDDDILDDLKSNMAQS